MITKEWREALASPSKEGQLTNLSEHELLIFRIGLIALETMRENENGMSQSFYDLQEKVELAIREQIELKTR